MKIQVAVFYVTPYGGVVEYQRFRGPFCRPLHFFLRPEDGGSIFLRSILPYHYTASQLRRPRYESTTELR